MIFVAPIKITDEPDGPQAEFWVRLSGAADCDRLVRLLTLTKGVMSALEEADGPNGPAEPVSAPPSRELGSGGSRGPAKISAV